MKIILSSEQVATVEKALKQAGLSHGDLTSDWLDHTCCWIENEMENNTNFTDALNHALEKLGKTEIDHIQKKIIVQHQKYKAMKLLSFLFIFSGLSIFFYQQNDSGATISPNPISNSILEEPPFLYPIADESYPIKSGFGKRIHPLTKQPKMHKGVDIPASIGTPVIATGSGVVLEADYSKGYGYFITIQHDSIYQTKYCHLSKIMVTKNQKVEAGETIGAVGSSGKSLSPHLHYEVIESKKHVNPENFIRP